MKIKYFIYAIIVSVTIFGCNKNEQKPIKNEFHLTGKIDGVTEGFFFRMVEDSTNARGFRMDTIKISADGKIDYTGHIEKLERLNLFSNAKSIQKNVGEGYIPSKANLLSFYAFPGAEIKVKGNIDSFVNVYPQGDSINDLLGELNSAIYPLINESADLTVKSYAENDTIPDESLSKMAAARDEKAVAIRLEFVKNHPNSIVSVESLADLISRGMISDEDAMNAFNGLSETVKDNQYFTFLEERINGIKLTAIGQPLPEIKTNSTLDGQPIDLKDYKGKYFLIDFWGTWCGPCVKELPELGEYYKTKKDNLEFIGINSGDTKEMLKAFLDKNEAYSWRQILNASGESADNFVQKLNIIGFPTKIVIDPNGVIIKKIIGTDENVLEYLEGIL